MREFAEVNRQEHKDQYTMAVFFIISDCIYFK